MIHRTIPITREAAAAILAMLAMLLIIAGFSLAMIYYNTTNGRPYSPFNHLASELGWAKVTSGAWIYNLTVFIAAILFIPIIHTMGRHIGTKLGWAATTLGVCTALMGSSLGAVSMDRLVPHLVLASFFFVGALLMAGMFAAAIWFSEIRRHAKWPLFSCLALFLSCSILAANPKQVLSGILKTIHTIDRPEIWRVAVMEWCVIAFGGFWLLSLVLYFLKKQPPGPLQRCFNPFAQR